MNWRKKYYQQFFVSSKKRDNRSDLDPKIVFFFSDMANNSTRFCGYGWPKTKKYMKKITCIGCEITRGKFWRQFLAGQPALPNIENLKKRLAPALTGALTWKYACRSLMKLYNFDILWNFLSDELFIITKFKKRLVYASHPCDVTSQSPNSVF